MFIPIPPIKSQLRGEELNLVTLEVVSTTRSIGHVTINFSALAFYEVYTLQNVIVAEMKVREGALVKKVRSLKNNISKMKKIVKEISQKYKTFEDDKNWLNTTVTLACSNFVDKSITN